MEEEEDPNRSKTEGLEDPVEDPVVPEDPGEYFRAESKLELINGILEWFGFFSLIEIVFVFLNLFSHLFR